MDMILIRHAAAIDAAPGQGDAGRELTPEGRIAAGDCLPELKKHIDTGREIAVWASPALRASQTARIVADGLNVRQITEFNWIYTGEYDALAESLNKAGNAAALIIVGHMPALGDWGYRLSGERIAFRKGGMAGFKLTATAPPAGGLVWLNKASRQADADKAAMEARIITPEACLQKLTGIIGNIQKLKLQFLKEPGDTECAHQLRVMLRKARSLLSLMKPSVKGEGYRDAQARLQYVAGRLSCIREIDVLARQLRSHTAKSGKAAAFTAMGKALKRERMKEQSALSEYFSGGKYDGEMKKITARISGWFGPGQEPVQFDRQLRRRFETWNRKAAAAFEGLNPGKLRQVHSLRIRLKGLRNAQSLFPTLSGRALMEQEELKSLETFLGRICDTHASIAVLKKMRAAYETGRLKKETEAFAEHLLKRRKKMEGRLASLRGGSKPNLHNP